MNQIIVRRASAADAALIATLSRQTFYDTFARSNTAEDMDMFMNEQFTLENLVAEVGAPGNLFLLAYDGEEAVGYVRMRKRAIPEELGTMPAIEIARIYAVQHKVGKGVGKALMRECIDAAVQDGYGVIWLGVWEKNQPAIDFYTKWGFEKFGEHPFVLGKDVQTDWLMRKLL